MHILIATTGALSPGPAVEFTRRLIGSGAGRVTVTTVIEVPHSFLEQLKSDTWHPLDDDLGLSPSEEEELIEKYVEERGRRLTEPIVDGLLAAGIDAAAHYLHDESPAKAISHLANDLNVDLVVLGATRQIFDNSAWESVSAQVMIESGRPVLVLPSQLHDLAIDVAEADA